MKLSKLLKAIKLMAENDDLSDLDVINEYFDKAIKKAKKMEKNNE